MDVNESDLQRCGITKEHELGVRIAGGVKVLRDALKAAGAPFEITHHTPQSWHEVAARDGR